jgi:prophage regulatory protein
VRAKTIFSDRQNSINEAALLRLPQVLALVPISRSAWWQGCRDGRYPKPIRLGPRTTVWRASDILALIDSLTTGLTAVPYKPRTAARSAHQKRRATRS